MNIKIPDSLFTTFNDVEYHDEPHKYYIDGKPLVSVTTLLHDFINPFDEDYWLPIKAKEYGITEAEVKRAWTFINKKGTMKGSIIHDYTENKFLNKVFPYPKQSILDEFGFDPIWEEYLMTKKHVDAFYDVANGKLIPIRTEMVVYDRSSLIGGMLDMLFYNVKAKEYQIWDWKTNKEFTYTESKRHFLGKLCMLEDSDLEMYSLQLQLYKKIIETHTGLKLGNSYLVWFSHNNPTFEVIKTKDRSFYADSIFNDRLTSINK